MKKIHENLKRVRMEKAMTQQVVANIMFVTRQCISKWEQGNLHLTIALKNLLKYIGCQSMS